MYTGLVMCQRNLMYQSCCTYNRCDVFCHPPACLYTWYWGQSCTSLLLFGWEHWKYLVSDLFGNPMPGKLLLIKKKNVSDCQFPVQVVLQPLVWLWPSSCRKVFATTITWLWFLLCAHLCGGDCVRIACTSVCRGVKRSYCLLSS